MAVPFLKENTPLQTGNGKLVGLGESNKPINEGAGLNDGDSDILGVIVVLFKTAPRATFPVTTIPEETDAATAAVAATAMPICTLAVAAAPAAAPAAAADAPAAAAAAPAVALAAADAAAPALAAA